MTVTTRMTKKRRPETGRLLQNHYVDTAWKLVGGVVGAVTGAAKHAVWYLRYQVEGVARDDPNGHSADAKES